MTELQIAERKAMSLLYRKIGKAKAKQLKKLGYFEEQGKAGVFRFHKNKQGGVSLLIKPPLGQKERIIELDLCVQSQSSDLPPGDVILSRWLEWRADEEAFLDTANLRKASTRDEARDVAQTTPVDLQHTYSWMVP